MHKAARGRTDKTTPPKRVVCVHTSIVVCKIAAGMDGLHHRYHSEVWEPVRAGARVRDMGYDECLTVKSRQKKNALCAMRAPEMEIIAVLEQSGTVSATNH
jgi:hypothetical protein